MATTDTIQIKRGIKSALPKKALTGELLLCEDTKEIYAGIGETGDVFLVGKGARVINGGNFGDYGKERNVINGGYF